MENTELLSAISEMMDCKFIQFEEKVDQKLIRFEEKVDQKFIQFEEKVDQKFIQFEEKVDQKFERFEEKMDLRFSKIEDTQNNNILPRLTSLELQQENVIIPLLHEIHACYCSTYDKSAKTFDDYEQMKNDISNLKSVVAKHSKQLQSITS